MHLQCIEMITLVYFETQTKLQGDFDLSFKNSDTKHIMSMLTNALYFHARHEIDLMACIICREYVCLQKVQTKMVKYCFINVTYCLSGITNYIA